MFYIIFLCFGHDELRRYCVRVSTGVTSVPGTGPADQSESQCQTCGQVYNTWRAPVDRHSIVISAVIKPLATDAPLAFKLRSNCAVVLINIM